MCSMCLFMCRRDFILIIIMVIGWQFFVDLPRFDCRKRRNVMWTLLSDIESDVCRWPLHANEMKYYICCRGAKVLTLVDFPLELHQLHVCICCLCDVCESRCEWTALLYEYYFIDGNFSSSFETNCASRTERRNRGNGTGQSAGCCDDFMCFCFHCLSDA